VADWRLTRQGDFANLTGSLLRAAIGKLEDYGFKVAVGGVS
jgi:hypothetical protein